MSTNFYQAVDHASTTLAQPYTAGSGTLTVTDGSVFGTPSPTSKVPVTLYVGTSPLTEVIYTVLEISGRSGNVLTVAGPVPGYTDTNVPTNAKVEARVVAKYVNDLNTALQTCVTTTGSYADPAWVTSLAGSKVTGNITGNAAGITGTVTEAQVQGLVSDLVTINGNVTANTSAIATKATDTLVVHLAGTETVTGVKTFSQAIVGDITGNAASITGNVTEGQVTNLTTDLASKALDSSVVHLAGTETITGTKTFTQPITGNVTGTAGTITGNVTEGQVTGLTTDLASKALDGSVVHNTGDETIAGLKTFSSPTRAAGASVGFGGTYPAGRRLRLDQTDGLGSAAVMEFANGTNSMYWFLEATGSGNKGQLRTDSSTAIILQSNVTTTGHLGVGTESPAGKLHVQPASSSDIGLVVQGQTTQTGDLIRVEDSTGATLTKTDHAGNVTATSFTGSGSGLTSIPESGVTGLVSDLAAKATDTLVVHLAGAETISGVKTYSQPIVGSVTGTSGGLSSNITESQVTNLTTDLAAKAPLASPALTGTPTAPTAPAGTNSTQIATTSYVQARMTGASVGSHSGVWYTAVTSGNNTAALALNLAEAIPVVFAKGCTIDQLALSISVAGSTGAVVRLGVYADDGSCYPGALLVDAGTIDATTTGAKTITLGTPLSVTPGIYWLVGCSQGAPTTAPTVQILAGNMPMIGATSAASLVSTNATSYTASSVAGAFPANWTATVATTTNGFRVMYHVQ